MHRDAHKYQERYLEVFASVQTFARRRIDGVDVLLSHFPYDNDTRRLEKYKGLDKFAPYRLRDEGLWLLHGHTHENVKQRSDRQVHVGVDAWDLSPVDLASIQGLMTDG
jgi:calcineurin-like phosphoesterase family protein